MNMSPEQIQKQFVRTYPEFASLTILPLSREETELLVSTILFQVREHLHLEGDEDFVRELILCMDFYRLGYDSTQAVGLALQHLQLLGLVGNTNPEKTTAIYYKNLERQIYSVLTPTVLLLDSRDYSKLRI